MVVYCSSCTASIMLYSGSAWPQHHLSTCRRPGAAHSTHQFSTDSRRGEGWRGSSSHSRRFSIPAKQLTSLLKSACGPEQLLQLVQQHAAHFDHIHLSAAYTQTVVVCRKNVAPQKQPVAVQELLCKLHELAEQMQQQCEARQLANIIWSCGRLSNAHTASGLLPVFLQDRNLQHAQPQGVSNVVWAAATLKLQPTPQHLPQMLQRFHEVLPVANPQAVANTMWAVATMQQQVPQQLLQAMLLRFEQVLPLAKPQEVANTLWACAKMQCAPLQLLSALEQHPQQLWAVLTAAEPQHLANRAWACGQLGYRGKLLPGALLQQAVQWLQARKLLVVDVCQLCWSAAVLDLQLFVPQVLQLAAASNQLWDTAITESLQQLYQVHLWLLDSQLPAPGQGLSGVLSQQQLEQCRASWAQAQAVRRQEKSSGLQMAVLDAVRQLPSALWQQPPAAEQVTADGVFSVDIATTTASGVKVAIEVDGPTHFIKPGNRLEGGTMFRNRALAVRGYVVISIPYWEWGQLRGAKQKQQYLLAKLQPALQAASS
jgi:hypothetical protein